LQNISGNHAATWWQKLAADFPSLSKVHFVYSFCFPTALKFEIALYSSFSQTCKLTLMAHLQVRSRENV